MRAMLVVISSTVCAVFAGCNTTQLRYTSRQQARTALDLQYQQVLDNVALVHVDPEALPSFALVDQGTVLVDTTATASVVGTWSPFAIVSSVLSGGGQRHFSGNWVLKPINGGDRLGAMQYVYQIATGHRGRNSDADAACRDFLSKYDITVVNGKGERSAKRLGRAGGRHGRRFDRLSSFMQ